MRMIKTILLIDDEPEILRVFEELLTRFGYQVMSMPDAESALFLIREKAGVDLVITDLHLPGMSGEEFITQLRSSLPSVPVIILTGHGSIESYIQTRSSDVFEYLSKPVRAEELRRIVSAALDIPAGSQASNQPLPAHG